MKNVIEAPLQGTFELTKTRIQQMGSAGIAWRYVRRGELIRALKIAKPFDKNALTIVTLTEKPTRVAKVALRDLSGNTCYYSVIQKTTEGRKIVRIDIGCKTFKGLSLIQLLRWLRKK